MDKINDKHLAWFLGPKGENSRYFEEILNDILRDYVHWRKNYFPEDDLLISKSRQKEEEFEKQIDSIYHKVYKMMGDLKRNFPFYSPRYMAHMLSDISMPSMLGYFAGMLFNANNVTPEASPVATEWEIQASNALIHMIGYRRSPKPPNIRDYPKLQHDVEFWKNFGEELGGEFAWGHITAGGTISNIEALWVARNVKYLPLGILEAYMRIKKGNYDQVRSGGEIVLGKIKITEFEPIELEKWESDLEYKREVELGILNLPSKEAISLLQQFYKCIEFKQIDEEGHVDNITQHKTKEQEHLEQNKLSLGKKIQAGLYLLSETDYYKDLPGLLSKYPPLIYAPCTAHYSINKAADILGIPRNNVILVRIDSNFRMDIDQLNKELQSVVESNKVQKQSKIAMAVIGVCGTTEEGAVDPIHKIVKLREDFQKSKNVYERISFWVHADAAYGGMFASLLKIAPYEILQFYKAQFEKFLKRELHAFCLQQLSGSTYDKQVLVAEIELKKENCLELSRAIAKGYFKHSSNQSNLHLVENVKNSELFLLILWYLSSINSDQSGVTKNLPAFIKCLADEHDNKYLLALEELKKFLKNIPSSNSVSKYRWNEDTMIYDLIQSFVNGNNETNQFDGVGDDRNEITSYRWGDLEVYHAFTSLQEADSVTIDPHKMGYVQYPSGFVAFKNDKIRNFIKQGAPYITSSVSSVLDHQAPRHLENIDMERLSRGLPPCSEKNYKIAIDAFAPYILEGSKPAAAAASLWLTTEVINLDIHNYGQIIIHSIRAVNELHNRIAYRNRLITTDSIEDKTYTYKIVSLVKSSPDTNVLVFFIQPFSTNKDRVVNLKDVNDATLHVYNKFHISAEHGDRKTSYSQEFFISKTIMSTQPYKVVTLDFHREVGHVFDYEGFEQDYHLQGLEILRMTLMNPYIYSYIQSDLNLVDKFLKEVDEAMRSFELK